MSSIRCLNPGAQVVPVLHHALLMAGVDRIRTALEADSDTVEMIHRPFRAVYGASSERDLPRVRLVDMKAAADVAAAMAAHFGTHDPRYQLSPETRGLLEQGVTAEQAVALEEAWLAKSPVDRTMVFKKGNTRIIDKIVGAIHDGSYNGRYISLFLQWDDLKDKPRQDVIAFIKGMTHTQQSLMAIAVYVATGGTTMRSYACGLQTAHPPPTHERSRSPSPSPSPSLKR